MAKPTGNSWFSFHPLSINLNSMCYIFSRRQKNNRIRGPVEEKPHIMSSKLRDKQPHTAAYGTVGRTKRFSVLIIIIIIIIITIIIIIISSTEAK